MLLICSPCHTYALGLPDRSSLITVMKLRERYKRHPSNLEIFHRVAPFVIRYLMRPFLLSLATLVASIVSNQSQNPWFELPLVVQQSEAPIVTIQLCTMSRSHARIIFTTKISTSPEQNGKTVIVSLLCRPMTRGVSMVVFLAEHWMAMRDII